MTCKKPLYIFKIPLSVTAWGRGDTNINSRVHRLFPSGFLMPKYPTGQEARHTPTWRMSLRSRKIKSLGLHLTQPLYSEHRSQPLGQDGGPSVLTTKAQSKHRERETTMMREVTEHCTRKKKQFLDIYEFLKKIKMGNCSYFKRTCNIYINFALVFSQNHATTFKFKQTKV